MISILVKYTLGLFLFISLLRWIIIDLKISPSKWIKRLKLLELVILLAITFIIYTFYNSTRAFLGFLIIAFTLYFLQAKIILLTKK